MIILKEKEKNKIDEISKITITNYGVEKMPNCDKYLITDDNILALIEDLLLEYHSLEEKIQELESKDD